VITSPHNPLLKDIRRLQRRRDERFVAEGEDLVEAAAAAGWPAEATLRAGVDVEPELLDRVSALGSGTRVVGVYRERWGRPTGPLCVALWGVGDPGNVGTVLRGAQAFGAGSVAIGPSSADPFGPKAVRASMGAVFAVPVARVAAPGELAGETVALVAHGGDPLAAVAPKLLGEGRPASGRVVTVVVGAERSGVPEPVAEACERRATIPIAAESLNAAMAATVALYELTRIPAP